jgi:predicted RNase H-like nuclease (RuvC/YqgF family)
MTDNEIVKSLEICTGKRLLEDCPECPNYESESRCKVRLSEVALDLINRQKAELQKVKAELKETTEKFNCQQYVYTDLSDIIREKNAEIEKLQSDNSSMQSTLAKMSMGVEQAKAEAIKEFAERLKEKQQTFISDEYAYKFIYLIEIDKLVKEMVGESDV